jgi:hypothetical protein
VTVGIDPNIDIFRLQAGQRGGDHEAISAAVDFNWHVLDLGFLLHKLHLFVSGRGEIRAILFFSAFDP